MARREVVPNKWDLCNYDPWWGLLDQLELLSADLYTERLERKHRAEVRYAVWGSLRRKQIRKLVELVADQIGGTSGTYMSVGKAYIYNVKLPLCDLQELLFFVRNT